jgi:hypothetical protein
MMKPSPILSSDQLGEKGESKFKDLCSDVGLIANKATQDRAGWDYLIQAPQAGAEGLALDARPALFNAYVQVKAVWRGPKPAIRLRLSSAEMLAKQHAASFIIALAFSRADISDFDLYAIELSGENLARILKSLRQQQKAGARSVNDASITFLLRREDRIQSTGEALSERLRGTLRHGEAGYVAEKAVSMEAVGYPKDRYKALLTLHDIDPLGAVEVFLGEREVPASISDAIETRFDIALPTDAIPTGAGVIRLEPKPKGECHVVVRSEKLRRPATFKGRYYYAQVQGPDGIVWKSRSDFAAFTITRMHDKITLNTKLGPESKASWPLATWIQFHLMVKAMTEGPTDFELHIPGGGRPQKWTFHPHPDLIPDIDDRIELFEITRKLLREASVDISEISSGEVYENQRSLIVAAGFGVQGARHVRISLVKSRSETPEQPKISLFIGFVDLAGRRIAYAAQMTLVPVLTPEGCDWQSRDESPVLVEGIEGSPEAFAFFVESAKALSGIEEVLLGEMDASFAIAALGSVSEF